MAFFGFGGGAAPVQETEEERQKKEQEILIEDDVQRSDQMDFNRGRKGSLSPDLDHAPHLGFGTTTADDRTHSYTASFVAIDLYAQDSSEYMVACLLSAFVQTPIMFCFSELLDGSDPWSPFSVTLIYSSVQLVTISFFFIVRGINVLDVPADTRCMLFVRSMFYAIGINAFVYSLVGLNPVSAMIALHSGLVGATVLFRFFAVEQMFFTMTVGKITQITLFIQLCIIPGLCTVNVEKFDDKNYTIEEYWIYMAVGITSGLLLGIVSRMTSGFVQAGKLCHEAYMTFYAVLATVFVAPIMFSVEVFNEGGHVKTDLSKEQLVDLIQIVACLLFLSLFKAVYLERDMMKRMVEDFDESRHGLPEIDSKEHDTLEEPYGKQIDIEIEETQSKNGSGSFQEAEEEIPETHSEKLQREYEERMEAQKRHNINLSVLMLPFVLIVYLAFRESDIDLQMMKQAKIDEFGSSLCVGLTTFSLGVLTYWDDLLITF